MIIYPGLGLGGTYRPRLAGTMGYAPVGSVLPPVGEIISAEPIGDIISDLPDSVTSDEIADVISSLEELLIESVEVTNVVSSELHGDGTVERLKLEISTFAQVANVWGSTSGVSQIGQSIYLPDPDFMVSAVEIVMRFAFGTPTDNVTLTIHEYSGVQIPENPPIQPDDGDIVATSTISSSTMSTSWAPVRFEFPPFLSKNKSYALLLSRDTYSDADYYGAYSNEFANYPDGHVWAKLLTSSWGSGATVDLPLKVYGSFEVGGVTSEESNDMTSELPSDIISDEPIDGLESEEPT
jgi:hypothetical protein